MRIFRQRGLRSQGLYRMIIDTLRGNASAPWCAFSKEEHIFGIRILSTLTLAAVLAAVPALAGDNCGHGHKHLKAGSDVEKSSIEANAGKKDYRTTYPEIKRDDLVKAINGKSVFLVDANGMESYADAHIPGAVGFDKVKGEFSQPLPSDKASLIVAYCGGPQCEAWCMAADKLETMGYTNIRHYKGGIKEWKQAGLETASAKTKG